MAERPPLPNPPPPGGRGQDASPPSHTRGQDGTPLGQASGQDALLPRQPDHPSPLAGDGPGERGSTAPYDALILAVAHRDFIDLGAAQQAQIGILGLGYVGLPLMPRYAEVGYLPGSAGLA